MIYLLWSQTFLMSAGYKTLHFYSELVFITLERDVGFVYKLILGPLGHWSILWPRKILSNK